VGSLVAVAVLPSLAGITGKSYLRPAEFSAGFHNAVLIAAVACVAGSLIAVLTIRNPVRAPKGAEPKRETAVEWQCGLDGPALCPPQGEAEAGQWGAAAHSGG
jgi:hypothetical protein